MDPTPSDDWISAVTRPLRDNPELELAARQELAELAASADPDQLGAIQQRFDAIDRTPPAKRSLLYLLPIVLAFLVVFGVSIPLTLHILSLQRLLAPMTAGTHSVGDEFANQLTPEEHFFVFGDTKQPTPELAARVLWQSQPGNAVLYGDYLARCNPFPADMLETARRIDPDNGWFLLLAAAELSGDAVEPVYPSWDDPTDEEGSFPKWQVTDEAKFDAALDLLREAAAKPRIEYYGRQLRKARMEMLPPETDLRSRLLRLWFCAASGYQDISTIGRIRYLLAAEAWLLGQSGNARGLEEFMPSAETVCRRLADQEGTILLHVINAGVASQSYEAMHRACERCELTKEARRLEPILRELENVPDGGRDHDPTAKELAEKHGGFLTRLTGSFAGNFSDSSPTPAEMKPERLMNYALFDRAALWAAAILMLASLVAALVLRHLRGRLSSRIGHRIGQLPGPRDWLWIFALGTVAPLAWLVVITRLTPLGCRDWGLTYRDFEPVAAQYAATLLLILSATIAAIRWRLGRYAGFLGPRSSIMAILSLSSLAIAIPIAGLTRFTSGTEAFHGAIALASVNTAWILILACRAGFGHRRHATRRAAVATLLAPALALAAILFVALLPLTHRAERYWIARDELMRTSPDGLGLNRLEDEASRTLQARLQQALHATPRGD